ncbi:putative DMT superfamily transporter inner membrane protein [Serratia quinivorans]|uniref:DMT family transporter n=1 Tax=Serratia quinivorans TaxID=137545 RepID=UPI002177CA10|nr:DMT family transporter [Serratia quinivorans]CAI1602804.1 putative DMT superfamily transporter inner membrane protein [Serratia quinivorans]
MDNKLKKIGIIAILFTLVALTWGTTWMAMKIAVTVIPPIYATGLRFLVAAPLLLLLAYFTQTPLLFPKGRRGFQLLVCVAYFAIPFTLMIYGERYVSSALASIIFANMPVAVLMVSVMVLGERISISQLTGLIIGVISLSGILWLESTGSGETRWPGVAALLAAVFIHAVMYVLCKKHGQKVSVLTYNALPCLGAGILLFTLGYFTEKPDTSLFTPYALLSVGYLGLVAGVFGILAYFALQQRASAFQASLVFLVFPLIAITIEKLVDKTTIANASLWLIAPLLIGILMTLYTSRNVKQPSHSTKNKPQLEISHQ